MSNPGNFDEVMKKLERQTTGLLETASETVNIDIDRQVAEVDIEAELAKLFKDFPEYPKLAEPTPEEVTNHERIYRIICEAGDHGIKVSEILAKLTEQGLAPDRATVYKWVEAMKLRTYKNKIERRPNSEGSRSGRWYRIGE